METHEQVSSPAADQVAETDRADGRQAGDDEISGLIRRVRRLAKLSQRELAHDLGVSQSAVAKWETGRTSPSARMLRRVLDVAKLRLVAVRQDGQPQGSQRLGGGRDGELVGDLVKPMKVVAARDAAGRRYPAHTFVWAEGWWAPEGSETTAWYDQILCRSEDLELPRVRYSRWWQLGRPPTMADIDDHPTWPELVAEAREAWRPPRRHVFPIPEWAFADTKKSRNRRLEDFRALARTVSLARSSRQPVGRATSMSQALVPAVRRG